MRAISASSETPRVTGSSAKENESPSVFPTEELSAVRSALLLWYRKNKRILPWRDTGDPEDVWISEIMLQQTRVEAVKGYFTRFREALPDAFAIAACPEDRLMKLWEGLGYYNRARNLQKCAEVLVRDYGGKLPADHEALLRLPGIGPYTAGAIASIAFGIPVPAVDGNVLRVWSRLTNNADDISLEATKQKFTSEIRPLLASDKGDREPSPVSSSVSDFTQALMELGAVVCVPNGAPLCEVCPLRSCCRGVSKSGPSSFSGTRTGSSSGSAPPGGCWQGFMSFPDSRAVSLRRKPWTRQGDSARILSGSPRCRRESISLPMWNGT